jgi:hypothetical protein
MQNIDVLWKECLHSDGEQCHQYQQNETHLSLHLNIAVSSLGTGEGS